ncbi:MAG: hypothetical protein Aurels2KO_25760 [Aureliella sp.]
MNDYRILWRGLRWVGSTSLLAVGYLAGVTVATSPAMQLHSSGRISVQPPAPQASSACQAEQDAYSAAYSAYEAAVALLNARYDDLYECQYGGSVEPEEPEQYAELAALPSVLETR